MASSAARLLFIFVLEDGAMIAVVYNVKGV